MFNFLKKKTHIGSESSALSSLLLPGYYAGTIMARPLNYYEKVIYVNRAIEKRGEKVGEIQFTLKDKGGNEVEADVLNLLKRPNPFQTGEQFFKLWQEYKDIFGEVFVHIVKEREFGAEATYELRLLDPRKCKPEHKDWRLTGIEYNGKPGAFTADEIIYDYRPDPRDQFRGTSLLSAGATTIETLIEFEKQNYKTVKSGGKVESVIAFDLDSITAEQAKEFKDAYQKQLEELPENGGSVFLAGNAKYQHIAKTMNELGYLDSRSMTLQDICILCDVTKPIINAFDGLKYDNAQEAVRTFLQETISPLMGQITTKLNEKTQLIPEELTLDYISPVPDDLESKLKIINVASRAGIATTNELREMIDLEQIEGGDEIQTPRQGRDEEVEVKKKDFDHPLKSKEFRLVYQKAKLSDIDKGAREFKRAMKKYLEGQKERIIQGIGQKRKDVIDRSFNVEIEISIGKEQFLPILRKYSEKAGRDAHRLVGSRYEFVWTNEVDVAINRRAELFLTSVNNTTLDKLKREFAESLEAGEGRQELIERITNSFSQIDAGRANTIARTEVHYTVNQATIEGYKQAGMNIKIWTSVLGETTRPWHADMDGVEVPIDMPFDVDGEAIMFPGEGSPENSINCQCVI